jgi:hypothetical protein
MHVFMMNELYAIVYRRLEINYFSRDISYKFSSDCYMLDHHYVLPFISILPRILIVAHSTLQKRV